MMRSPDEVFWLILIKNNNYTLKSRTWNESIDFSKLFILSSHLVVPNSIDFWKAAVQQKVPLNIQEWSYVVEDYLKIIRYFNLE